MANPVTMFPKLKSIREERMSKLSSAPGDHAEALLDLYELVEVLHDRGTLDLLRGLAGASGDIMGRLAEAGSKPESIRAARNLIELSKLLSRFDPEELQRTIEDSGEALARARDASAEPPGMWAIFRRMTSRDARRALSMFAELLNEMGRKMVRRDTSRDITRDASRGSTSEMRKAG